MSRKLWLALVATAAIPLGARAASVKAAPVRCPMALGRASAAPSGGRLIGAPPATPYALGYAEVTDGGVDSVSDDGLTGGREPDRSEQGAVMNRMVWETRGEAMLACRYGATRADAQDLGPRSALLLMPLPTDRPMTCTVTERSQASGAVVVAGSCAPTAPASLPKGVRRR